MKKNGQYIILLMLLTLLPPLNGQDSPPVLPEHSGERLYLVTDRELYTVTESIYFTVFYTCDPSTGQEALSKVLYVELLEWDGKKITGTKVPLINGLASGSIEIPGEINSGVYYLRAYTKWMRNFSPYLYAYSPLKILNPTSNKTIQGPLTNSIEPSLVIKEKSKRIEGLSTEGIKSSYGFRDSVSIRMKLDQSRFAGNYSISVTRSLKANRKILSKAPGIQFKKGGNNIDYLPEKHAFSLDGKVIDENNQNPVPGFNVILSSTVNPFYFFICNTDEQGFFHFPLPYFEGRHQFCLTSMDETSGSVSYLIENDYCTQELSLPFIPFELDEEELVTAREMSIAVQLQNIFEEELLPSKSTEKNPFYGKAQKTFIIDDYIQLGDVREFLFEIVPELGLIEKDRSLSLEFEKKSNLSIFPTLVLMDNIPVLQVEELLSLPSSTLDRIEISGGGYIVNNKVFSGLISFYSKKGDLGGMDFQDRNQFVTLNLFERSAFEEVFYQKSTSSHTPKTANLLYYNSAIRLDSDDFTEIEFSTGDMAGIYTIKIEGLTDQGEAVEFSSYTFKVE